MNQLEDYYYTVKSEETKERYEIYFKYFERFAKMEVTKLLKLPQKTIQNLLINYIVDMRERKLSSSSVKGRLAPIFSFLELNDVLINKKRVMKYLGEDKKTVKNTAYTIADIEKMVNICKPRTRLIILIYASTGIRRSALFELKLKHLEKIEEVGIYKFTIYENTKEEYFTFCTNECATAIDQYIELRKEAGEHITRESWLIRNDFDIHNKHSVENPIHTTGISVNTIFRNILVKVGLRSMHQKQNLRNEKSAVHAFRKFTTTQFVNSGLNPEIREMLLGHSIGLTGVYYKPTEEKMLSEYVKALDNLTIDPSNRLKREVKILEGREKEFAEYKKEMDSKMDRIIAAMQKEPRLAKIKPDVLRRKVK